MSLYGGLLLLTALVSLLLGIFVFWQGKQKLPNLTLALLSLAIAGWCGGQFMGEVVGTKSAVLLWTRLNIGAAVFIPVFYFHFILAFINQTLKDRRQLIGAYAGAMVLLLLNTTNLFVADIAPHPGYRYYPVPGVIYPFFALFLLILVGAGFFKLWRYMTENSGQAKNQARYLLVGSLIGFAGGATAFFPVFNISLPVVSYFALPLYLAITAYAIVKHQLLDINIVIREGLVYSALTILFASFYALVILIANRVFQNLTGFNEYGVTLLVVFSSVLVFQPLRDRVQAGVDRLFFRGEFYYQKTIDDLSSENQKLYRSLLQADKLSALGVIAAGMAHEIKNPLAAIKGLTQVLPENLGDSGFIAKYSEIVPRQLDRINRIVEDLLAFGQPKILAAQTVEVSRVLDDVLRLLENQCRKTEIAVRRDFKAGLKLTADPEQLTQAFMNIVLNAIQAMPRGGELKLTTNALPLTTIIEISDTGAGIPPEKLLKIFDPFYTTKEQGSGMGLAVTYRIIKEHGGEITVESTVGRGTTFKICLPIKPKRSA